MEEDPMIEIPDNFMPPDDGFGFPEAPKRDSLLVLMREIVGLQDPEKEVKAGNLTKEELGKPKLTVRDGLRISAYAEIEGHIVVANYIRSLSGSVASSGLSKDALLVKLPFTQRRESQNLGSPKVTTKKAWHGGETTVKEGVTNE